MTGSYHDWIVILSICVAIAASHAALSLAQRISRSTGIEARLWLAGGAFSMGMGIWSMHFIGMMAYRLPIPLAYDIPTTLLSLVIAVAASGYALSIAHHPRIDTGQLLSSALVLALGITSMHYVGMMAITVQPGLQYDLPLFLASVAVALVSSFVALWLFFRLRALRGARRHLVRLLAAVVMGLAVSGLHYTGMAATSFAPNAWCSGGLEPAHEWLAVLIGMTALGLLGITAVLMLVDTHLAARNRRHSEELQQANQRLQHAATHDSLTGLPNRALLMERLTQGLRPEPGHPAGLAVVAFDLDRFKAVNDTLGHAAGDDLLREVSRRITGTLRASDTLARMGGDEFVALLPGMTTREAAERLLVKVHQAATAPLRLSGTEVCVGISIGVAFFPQDGTEAVTLLKCADAAMYHAKRNAGSGVQFYNGSMDAPERDQLELENDLRRAVSQGELLVHYQPKIEVATGRTVGAEAMVRWRHPLRGLIPPSRFIPMAEQLGLIQALGMWVLRESCLQLRKWHDRGFPHLIMAVNVSAEQLGHEDLVQSVRNTLRDTGIPADCLELELTESAVMRDPQRSVRQLSELGEMGVRISVDDFGTGYSSLSYLQRLPLNVLKIDRSFIHDVERNMDDAEIVRAIVSLAHSLQLEVVAEGVETLGQLAFVRSLGCEQYQGYLNSEAVSPEAFLQALQHRAAGKTTTRLRRLLPLAG